MLLVDTQGLVHVLEVVPASVQDLDAVASIEPCLARSALLLAPEPDLGQIVRARQSGAEQEQ